MEFVFPLIVATVFIPMHTPCAWFAPKTQGAIWNG